MLQMGLAVIVLVALLWLLPFFIVLFSSRVGGLEKLGWLAAMIFISWFAWILFALLAPLNGDRRRYYS